MDDFLTRTRLLLGDKAVETIRRQHIFVAGLGGVGSYVTESLARVGVGKLTLHDADIVSESNINRQLIALRSTLGRQKTEVMRERVLDINPECQVTTQTIFITRETVPQIITGKFDIIIDAIDVFNCKLALLRYAWKKGLKTYSSLGAGNRLDPTKIRSGDLFQSKNCRLGKILRKKLRKSGISEGITAVWSEEIGHAITDPESEERQRPDNGTISTIPALFGITLAGLVIKDLVNSTKTV